MQSDGEKLSFVMESRATPWKVIRYSEGTELQFHIGDLVAVKDYGGRWDLSLNANKLTFQIPRSCRSHY